MERFFEDYEVGQKFGSRTLAVTAEGIKAFAAQFDPQPFHLDEAAARASFFGGLVASGWHTAAMTMRLLVDGELRPAGGTIGAGGSDLRWPRPVRPGDVLRVESEVLGMGSSPSCGKPTSALVSRHEMFTVLSRIMPFLMYRYSQRGYPST